MTNRTPSNSSFRPADLTHSSLERRRCAGWALAALLSLTAGLAGCGEGQVGGVVVSGPPVESVVVTPVTRTIVEGATAQLTARAFAEDGSEISTASMSWESSNSTIASVSATGLVTGVSAGAAQIQATARSGGGEATASSLVTVEADPSS